MESLFLKLLNLSLTASLLILAVFVLRLIFRKAPKWVFCVLWGLVAFRLIVPFSFESALSVIPSAEPIPLEITASENPQIDSGIQIIDNAINPIISDSFSPAVGESVNPLQIWIAAFSWMWLTGLAAMLIYAVVSTVLLKRKLRTATPFQKGIKQSEHAETPFVLGIIHPVIYLPYRIDDNDLAHVIAHEQAHIQRKDHWWKPLGFLLLSVYWFNPIIWVAYVFLCRDIEAACDEKVIGNMDTDSLRAYSEALLNCSVNRRTITACPIAFGEVGVKERVKNVMNYKKPAFWIILIAVLACIVIAVCFLTSPKGEYQIPWDQFCFFDGAGDAHEEIKLPIDDKKYIARLLNQKIWTDDARAREEWDYQFFFAEQTVLYDSQTGIFSDVMKKKSMTVSEEERQKINRMLGRTVDEMTSYYSDNKSNIDAPPVLTVTDGISKIKAVTGTYTWFSFDNSIGMNKCTNADSPSFDSKEMRDIFQIISTKPSTMDRKKGNEVVLQFIGTKPDRMNVSCMNNNVQNAGKTAWEPVEILPDFTIELLEGSHIYKVEADFGESHVSYGFIGEFIVPIINVNGDGENLDSSANGHSDEKDVGKLKEKYPEYFGLPTMKGLEVYVWQMAHNSYSFGLLSGTNRLKTNEELMNLKGATASEMKAILSTYNISDDMIAVIPFQNMLSSYIADYWISQIGESESSKNAKKEAYIQNIRNMLFEN